MSIFKFIQSRIRSFFRHRMTPLSVDEAAEKKEFFARLYLATAFFTFCYIFYNVYNTSKTSSTPEQLIKQFQMQDNVRVIKFEGFKKVADYVINPDSIENKESQPQDINPVLPVEVKEPKDAEFLKD